MAEFTANLLIRSVILGIIVLLVLCITPFLRKYTRKWRYIVFLVIGINLLIPYSIFSIGPRIIIPMRQSEDNMGVVKSYEEKGQNEIETAGGSQTVNTISDGSKNNIKTEDVHKAEIEESYEKTSVQKTDMALSEDSVSQNKADSKFVPDMNGAGLLTRIQNFIYSFHIRGILEKVFIVWITIATLLMVFYGIMYRYHRWTIRRWSSPVMDEEMLKIFEKEKQSVGIKKRVGFEKCKKISTPVVVGIFHISILIPDMENNGDELRYILRHEMTHIKHHDMKAKILFVIIKCIHWFNPLIQIMTKSVFCDIELICDDEVVKTMERNQRIQYNETILKVARKQSAYDDVEKVVFSLGLLEGKRDLKERMLNIMNMKAKKKGYIIALCLCFTAVAGGSLVACGGAKSVKEKEKITTAVVETTKNVPENTIVPETTMKVLETTKKTLSKEERVKLESIVSNNNLPDILKAALTAEYGLHCDDKDYTKDERKFYWKTLTVIVANSANLISSDMDLNIAHKDVDADYFVIDEDEVEELGKVLINKPLLPKDATGYIEKIKYDKDGKYYFPAGDSPQYNYTISKKEIQEDGQMFVKGDMASVFSPETDKWGYTIKIKYNPKNKYGYTITDLELDIDWKAREEEEKQGMMESYWEGSFAGNYYDAIFLQPILMAAKSADYVKQKNQFFWEAVSVSVNYWIDYEHEIVVKGSNKNDKTWPRLKFSKEKDGYCIVEAKYVDELAKVILDKDSADIKIPQNIYISYNKEKDIYYIPIEPIETSKKDENVFKKKTYLYDKKSENFTIGYDYFKAGKKDNKYKYLLTVKRDESNSFGWTVIDVKQVKK